MKEKKKYFARHTMYQQQAATVAYPDEGVNDRFNYDESFVPNESDEDDNDEDIPVNR